jgi:hypothetical protein
MGPSCISWEPDSSTPVGTPPRIVHVTKIPPSNSGIARHAAPFDRALDGLGPRVTLGLPVTAHESQRLSVVAGLLGRLVRQMRRASADLVVIDLSGRALAEFFAACLVAARRRGPTLWLIAHDAPEMVGPPLLFACFDRKGGRRLGMALSSSLGGALERWLVSRTDMLVAFSELGAEALRTSYPNTRTTAIPLPSEIIAHECKEAVIYCPASLSAHELIPTLRAFALEQIPQTVRLRVGNLPDSERRQVEDWCRSLGIEGRVDFTGFLDQAGLDRSFATAAIVVRHRDSDQGAANWAAASGPLVSALAAGCAVLSTDARGSHGCLAAAGIDLAAQPTAVPEELARLASDPVAVERLRQKATSHTRDYHVPEAVTPYLEVIWRETRRPDWRELA